MSVMITLEGIGKYAKVFEDNRDLEGYEGAAKPYDGLYTLDLYVDDVELQKLHDAGSKIQGVYDEESGLTKVKLKRKHKVTNQEGEVIEALSGPPIVKDIDGELWPHTEEMPSYIGNGSKLKVAVVVTQSKQRKAIVFTRLEGIQVLELVPYDPEAGGQLQLPF